MWAVRASGGPQSLSGAVALASAPRLPAVLHDEVVYRKRLRIEKALQVIAIYPDEAARHVFGFHAFCCYGEAHPVEALDDIGKEAVAFLAVVPNYLTINLDVRERVMLYARQVGITAFVVVQGEPEALLAKCVLSRYNNVGENWA